jgi:hypothetical protein
MPRPALAPGDADGAPRHESQGLVDRCRGSDRAHWRRHHLGYPRRCRIALIATAMARQGIGEPVRVENRFGPRAPAQRHLQVDQ